MINKKINLVILFLAICFAALADAQQSPEIRTPPPPHVPRINGPDIFGVRPGHPFLYHIPVTGDRPMAYSVDDLPAGLQLDVATGEINGTLPSEGRFVVTLHAKNAAGEDSKKFTIVAGETIALTPQMGWNSWNHYAERVSQEIVLKNAQAMASSGLIDHGWTYVNMDDTWQGLRGGTFNAIQGNEKFPDINGLCDAVHALGLKVGIYSTPWTTSYAGHIGGSAQNPNGDWKPFTGSRKGIMKNKTMPFAIGTYHFATNDADQWAAWGIDYLKYDWYPIEDPEMKEMADALRHSGRDILFSLSNDMNITNAPVISPVANSWRTTGDIKANWASMAERGFGQDPWARYASPGHWNDPDMLEIGTRERGQPGLTPDEEYTHMTIWCLDSAPLLLGNDLTSMDAFTLNLLENDEVLAVDQDSLGEQGTCVVHGKDFLVYEKHLEGGAMAVGLFNLANDGKAIITVKWSDLGIDGSQNLRGARSQTGMVPKAASWLMTKTYSVRDLWRQKDLGRFTESFSMPVAAHSAELVRIR